MNQTHWRNQSMSVLLKHFVLHCFSFKHKSYTNFNWFTEKKSCLESNVHHFACKFISLFYINKTIKYVNLICMYIFLALFVS
jgi:hypothetical protein